MTRNKSNHQNAWIIGATVAGLLGTLTSLLMPKRSRKGLTDQAREVAHHVFDEFKAWQPPTDALNKNLMWGGIAGGLVGVATALLLAPKSGSELLQDISDTLTTKATGHHQAKRQAHSKVKKAMKAVKAVKVAKAVKTAKTTAKKVVKKAAKKVAAATTSPLQGRKKTAGTKKAKTKRSSIGSRKKVAHPVHHVATHHHEPKQESESTGTSTTS